MKSKTLEIRKNILSDNDQQASWLRQEFAKNKTLVLNVVSSPGSGKTELLMVLSKKLIERGLRVCVIVGDLATDNDARRIEASGAATHQINTNGNCHLDAKMIESSLKHIPYQCADIILIENVGNLVCPASYDLGEALRIVLFSVTEGEDKPAKYPTMFNSAQICVISKIDLADAVEFDERLAVKNILNVNPNAVILKTSAKKDAGMMELCELVLTEWKDRADHDRIRKKLENL